MWFSRPKDPCFDKANPQMACQQKTLHPTTKKVEKGFDIQCIPFLFLLGHKENWHIFQVREKKQTVGSNWPKIFLKLNLARLWGWEPPRNSWWYLSGTKESVWKLASQWRGTPETWYGLDSYDLVFSVQAAWAHTSWCLWECRLEHVNEWNLWENEC